MRRTLALAGSLLMVGLLASACSDDTGTNKTDKGGRRDSGSLSPDMGMSDGMAIPDAPAHDYWPAQHEGPVSNLDGATSDKKPAGDAYVPPPANATCGHPKVLTLTGTPATVAETSSTIGAVDEFPTVDCGGWYTWEGMQVYYKVNLATGKKYKAVLTSSFDGALYAFPASTACDASAINTACTNPTPADPSNIFNSDDGGAGDPETIRIAPATTGDWIIVVDSYATDEYGQFTLTISEVVPPPNQTCSTAQTLDISTKATVSADTGDASNEFSNTITCGSSYEFVGPQLYYAFTIAANQGAVFTFTPTFNSDFYIFPASASCIATAIESGCASGGTSGMTGYVSGGDTGTFYFMPDTAGDFIIAVDSEDATERGAFDLSIEQYTAPANSKCSSPQALTLTTSPVTITGDTTGAPNQFGTTISCNSGYSYDGSQVYYKVTLQAGTTYTFDLTPSASWDPALYAFADLTCTPTNIETQCSATGMYADDGTSGDPEQLKVTPTTTADYIIAVDSYLPDELGTFTLKISW